MATQKEYIPWTPREEDSLEDWLQQHAHLSWAQKVQYYPKARTVDSLRSKCRALRRGGRRHSRIRTQHRHPHRSPRQRPRERPRERNPDSGIARRQSARSASLDTQGSSVGPASSSHRTRSPSLHPRSASPVGPDFSPATLEGDTLDSLDSSPPERISVHLEPSHPPPLSPPTRIAAMIQIGQSIIQLPLRLLG